MPEQSQPEQPELDAFVDAVNRELQEQGENPDNAGRYMQPVERHQGEECRGETIAGGAAALFEHGDEVVDLKTEEGKPETQCYNEPQHELSHRAAVLQRQRGQAEGEAAGQKQNGFYESALDVIELFRAGAACQRIKRGDVDGEQQPEDDRVAHHEDPKAEDNLFAAVVDVRMGGTEIQAGIAYGVGDHWVTSGSA